MDWGLLDHLRAEADVIAHAPIAFVLFLVVGCAIGGVVISRLNKAAIDGANRARDAAIQSRDYWKERTDASVVASARKENAPVGGASKLEPGTRHEPVQLPPNATAHAPVHQGITSRNRSGGITAGTVNVGKQEFALTPEIMNDLVSKAKADKPVIIQAIGGEQAREMGLSIEKAFRAAGFVARTNWIGVQSPPPDKPVSISLLPNRTFVTIAPDA
jgi:hypothetical protein